MIGIEDVREAAARIEGVARHTPVLRSAELDRLADARIFLKAEHLQEGGAFKIRGATSKVRSLDTADLARGVIAASSGNHAQGVALAARAAGASALVLMPQDAPRTKREATVRFGADVELFDRYSTDRDALLAHRADETDRVVVHPYDDELVMAGQGTAALELFEDVSDLDDLICPVGGGGLVSGCATVAAALRPDCRVWGVEPEAGDDTRRSLQLGRRVAIEVPRTIADGQQVTSPGVRPFAVIWERVYAVVTVSDAEIVTAMGLARDLLDARLEPSGACALAAVLTGRLPLAGRRVGVLLSGGNVDDDRYQRLLESGS